MVSAYLRERMQADAVPARDARDDRVQAAFTMAPGGIQGSGMDEAGLKKIKNPAYVFVGAGNTTTTLQASIGPAA